MRISGNWLCKIRFTGLKLQWNYDGPSLFKSSNQQLWPILGHITTSLVNNVFIVGIYGGEVKPSDFNDISAAPMTELRELLTDLAINRLNGMDESIFSSISLALELCKNHTTCDFQRKCRSLYEASVWKATECRDRIIYNVHSLKHIAEHVIGHRSSESFSAFPFESYMRKIRRSVHCGFAAAKQAAQRYTEKVYFQSLLDQDVADNLTEPGGCLTNFNDYLCTSEELEVAEVEAGFAPVDFLVVNTLTGKRSPIEKKGCAVMTVKMLKMIMKAAAELSNKTDKLIAFNKRSSMGVMDRRTDQVDKSTIAFALRTHEELRSCEVGLDELKFRDQFLKTLSPPLSRLMPFWPDDIEAWFCYAEADFSEHGVNDTRAQFLAVVKALLREFNRYVTPSMLTSDVSEPYEILKRSILKRGELTDRQRLDQLLNNIDLQHGSATDMLQRMREVIGPRTFDEGLFKQLFLSKPPQQEQAVLVSFQNNALDELHLPIES
ncbi:unnamed protein product [Schistosoma curassoni]|uniref:Protein kinase domain-containing protein n=1 Tax=Schistosoma curassoni TaxID=6186 RepID=A0A183KVD8_9TREM|nr:unnamed protein product [Schistosoma curassoni]